MAAKHHDRILEVLRSLSPPKGARKEDSAPSADGRPLRGKVPPAGTSGTPAGPSGPSEAGQAEVSSPHPRPLRSPERDGKVIQLRVEEAGVFFLAAVVLVVTAFLMGWYSRGPGAARPAPGAARGASPSAARGPALSLGPSPDHDLGDRPSGFRSVPARRGPTYSILVAKFAADGIGDAEDNKLLLKQHGYPAWLRPSREGIELCVGRFDSPTDRLAREWLPKIQALRSAYASAGIARIP